MIIIGAYVFYCEAPMNDAHVVVVGAGPTGLMLACELKSMGVDVVLIERRPRGTSGESRAPGINARTMEVFAQRGLAGQFVQRGRPLPAVLFSGIPMDPKAFDRDWPEALILPQHETERVLTERAIGLGVDIRWGAALLHVSQDEAGVQLLVSDGSGKTSSLCSDYAVGADGGHSVVRRSLGISFDGDDPLSHWLVADVELAAPPTEQQAFGRNSKVGTYQVSPVEPGWYRVSMMKIGPPVDSKARVTLGELREAMSDGLGTDFGLRSARWMSRFTDGFRQAARYRRGRVFLAGDAAHTHSPIGGQGLNLGIQDAANLGWKLARVALHGASDGLLDTYQEERYPVAEGVLQLARAQTLLIKPGRQVDALRGVVADMLAVPEVARRYAGALSGLSLRYGWGNGGHPLLGMRAPNLPTPGSVLGADVFSLMARMPGRFLWLQDKAGIEPADAMAPSLPGVERVDVIAPAGWHIPAIGIVPPFTCLLVRPDGYVAYVGDTEPQTPASAGLLDALRKWQG
ncbi:3-(3-hydroxyphenyl)propionate hydroxylase [Paracidovorax avenae]|nr:3-(3-hydroxyphenyl)propionate hydroxylase [Paracidovorax avenae]AVT09871.1 3-(3-hydroxyphenyl)propionate hydroxylase [Paracidovorax avenae]